MSERVQKFKEERERLNDKILAKQNVQINRFFALDTAVYREGILPVKTKEMLGLVASLVLRCDDCITYHTLKAKEEGVTSEEYDEVLSVGLLVGGSITIPHIRRATDLWEEISK